MFEAMLGSDSQLLGIKMPNKKHLNVTTICNQLEIEVVTSDFNVLLVITSTQDDFGFSRVEHEGVMFYINRRSKEEVEIVIIADDWKLSLFCLTP